MDLEVPRSSRGGGTSHFNGLAGQSELIASQKPDWEAYGKQRRDFSGAALRISSSSPATREDAAGTHATAELALFGSKAAIRCSCSDHCTTFAPGRSWQSRCWRLSLPGRLRWDASTNCMRAIGQGERALEAETNGLDAALTLIDEGLGFSEETSERFSDPYLHRLRGDILLKRDPANPAPADVARARISNDCETRGDGRRTRRSLSAWLASAQSASVRRTPTHMSSGSARRSLHSLAHALADNSRTSPTFAALPSTGCAR